MCQRRTERSASCVVYTTGSARYAWTLVLARATRVLSLVCMLSLPRRWKQPQLFTVVALALISTLGLIAFTGSHLDAVPSLPRRRHLRTTRLRLRSALEQDDFPEVSYRAAEEHTFHIR